MFYLIETYWVWFVAAITGVVVGYLTTSEQAFRWLSWVPIPFAVGLIVAIFGGLPDRAGLYLLLGVVFFWIVGRLVGGLMRKLWAHLEPVWPKN
jgi:hypothetical protein